MAARDASVTAAQVGPAMVLTFAGRLDAAGAGDVWDAAHEAARQGAGTGLAIDLAGVSFIDLAGATLLASVQAAHVAAGGGAAGDGSGPDLRGADSRARALFARACQAGGYARPPKRPPPPDATMRVVCGAALTALTGGIAFLGEVAVASVRLPARRRMLRMQDLLRYADQAGVRSLPLVALLGYLMGLILAFQSAIPLRRFGADLFVANLVAISLIRELGPLLAAVILAGRTGSAFAAEIGTMKVNEEVDAMTTMGLDPMTMLVLPRLVAAMLVMPVMTLALELAGLAGMATVMSAFNFPLVAILRQVQGAVTAVDLFGGLFKAVCFGSAVAAIGCRAGLATGVGPRAVGLSATAAVVGGIVSTILLDGVFALLFYRLGL
ncbi:MAG: ABC transporter permease [Proteobacteria bacterium]|nr:ABC transporter permease [Pseudomonadota bacterium]